MHSAATSGLRPILSILIVAVVYFVSLWRIIKSNRGNKVIECGSIALMISLLMVVLIRFPSLPAWVMPSLGALLLLLCLLTIFFLVAKGVQAIRHRKSSAETDTGHTVYGLDYEPRARSPVLAVHISFVALSLGDDVVFVEILLRHLAKGLFALNLASAKFSAKL
jgi:hypothetical protein